MIRPALGPRPKQRIGCVAMFGLLLALFIGVAVIFDWLNPTKSTEGSDPAAATVAASPDADAPTPLTKLIDHCDPIAISHNMCGDFDKPVWRKFQADNGEITKVDMSQIEPGQYPGTAIGFIYTFSPGTALSLEKLHQIYFTCRGQYEEMTSPLVMLDAPPGSVIGMVAATVCPIADAKRRAIKAGSASESTLSSDDHAPQDR